MKNIGTVVLIGTISVMFALSLGAGGAQVGQIGAIGGGEGGGGAASKSPMAAQLHELFAEQFAWRMREFPEDAMEHGDYSNADKLTDTSLAAIERRHAETADFLKKLQAIDKTQLNADERLNYELFDLDLRNDVEGHRFRAFLAPVGGRFGPQQTVPQMHVRARFNSAEDYTNYLKRLEAVPRMAHDTIELLKLGVKEGRTPPRVTMMGVPEQFQKLAEGGLDALAEPFAKVPASISAETQAGLRKRFDAISLPAVRGAIKEMGDYVTNEYVPKCRKGIAAIEAPDGEAWYAFQLRTMTTTDMTAKQIHETGLKEVARIKAEMMKVIRSSDFMRKTPEAAGFEDEKLFKAFVNYLRTDARFYFTSEDDLLRGYRDVCKRIDAELPKVFRVLPRLPYGVRKIPDFMAPVQTTAYYSKGDIRNAQPGYFYANTYALNQRPKYEMTALALHESVPGHHLQIALAQELENEPEFRKDAWFTAFGEGWALYSERLGIEMGLYGDSYDDFGRLMYEMWRACRLVVDPGMHALGWSREQAVEFMRDNAALTDININAEIDRYIAWPGQATAYKIGELKIRELRARAEEKLGKAFDLRAFHNVVLRAGTLPLTILETRVNEWIAQQSGRS